MLTRYVRKNVTWIDCISPTPAEVRTLMHEFDIDPLIAEELLLPSFKSKVERRGELIYAILHFPVLRGAEKHPVHEIDFIIGKKILITTRYENSDPLHAFTKAFEVESVLGRDDGTNHGGHMFISMVSNLYQALGNENDAINRRLHNIEEHIFGGEERRMVVELSRVGRIVHDFRQTLAPHAEILASLEPVGARSFGAEFSYHVRSLLGVYNRTARVLETIHDSLDELRETNNSLLSTKQNEIMKTLTIMAFVTFPLTLISSIFGMNTEYLPIVGLPGDFWIVTGMMLALAMGFFIYFKSNKWL